MARIDRVRESYEQITERLFGDKTAFEQYLKFAGKFFKLPSEQTMTIYGTNPNAAMVADFETWKKFSRRVKRGTNSIAVLDNGSLKHYFDISQTSGSITPYQWTLDKETANAIIAETFENEGKHFSSFSGCVNYLGSEKARENLDSVIRSLNISEEDRAAFEKSYISMTQYFIAARCEVGGSFKYNGSVDLSALDMLHSKAEKEKLCECVQLSGKSVLLSMEKSIHEIELQRRNNYGRNQANLVRRGQDVLSRNQGGERQAVQAGQGNVRVSGTAGAGSDSGRAGIDERADRSLGSGMAEVYDGKSPRSNSVPERSAEMGADTPTDRQGSVGVQNASEEAVRREKSPSENIRGNSEMGEHSRNDTRQSGDRGHSSSVSGVNGATYSTESKSTENTEQTAEVNAPAVSVSADKSELLAALEQHREIFFEDEPEQMIANANSGRATNLRVAFDEDLGKFILRGDYHKNVEVIESAWLSDKSTAEEMEQLIKQKGYEIRGYGDLTEEKVPEVTKPERTNSEAAEFSLIAERTREYLRSESEKSAMFPLILSEMDKNSTLAETAYSRIFAYCYEDKIMLKDAPDEDIAEIIAAVVEERANELRQNFSTETLEGVDKFYVNEENESVTWAYFNPDSSAGGQLVYHTFTYDQLFDALVMEDPLDYLEQVSKTELVDVTEPNFASIAQEFLADNESFYSRYNDVGAKLSALVEPRYGIFQLKGGEELRDYHFESAERLKKNGLYIDRENYDRVYRGRLREGETLDDIYQRFNIDHPADFRGHSLSVSDIICVKSNGTTAAYYVDSVGFTRVPDFTLDREERKARRTLTDNLTLIAENQLASDEMDDLGEKLFDYENAPNYGILSSSWTIGAGLHSNEFQSLTTRYFNGEDIRAELAQKIYGNMTHIEFYEFPPADGIGYIEISTEKTDSGMTFRTKGGFEITHSWETLGEALITAARQEFDRHEELDREYVLTEAKSRINEYTQREFGEEADFSDLSRIPLAYTTHEDTNVEITVYADLVDNKMVTMYGDNIADEHRFEDPDDMLSTLGNLEFSDLTVVASEIVEKYTPTEETEIQSARETEPQEKISSDVHSGGSPFGNETAEMSETVQLNLFGEPMENDKVLEKTIIGGVDIEEALKYELTHHGTGFQDGKFRVEQFHREHPDDTKEFAKFLSKEYGVGGHTCEGRIDMASHDSKGIHLDIKLDNGEKTSVTWSWQKVAVRVSELIDNQTYITQKDIDSRIRNAQNEVSCYAIDTPQYQRSIAILEQYGLSDRRDEQVSDKTDEQPETAPKLKDTVIDLTARPEHLETPVEKHDFTISDENLGTGGAKTKFAANIAAIKTLKAIESENRLAAPDEQAVLAQYVGWGGLAQAFDENNSSWAGEYKQLRELLTDEEYTAAKGSTLNAHYTSPTVINAIYKGLENLGFDGGNILEPAMGVGNFFGTMPEEIRRNSHLHGVELDSISGRIARQLYQSADIQITGFEKTDFPDNFFDAAIGNVPFGNYGISDARYNKENFLVHDYFFAKTLDKVAPGGVVAFITSKGTLDKANPKVREYLAKRADLIGAIRLPNNAFKGANTEVTSDIIFLQKREKMAVELPDWCYTAKNSDGITVNQYFIDNPEMVLGKLEFTSGQFGQEVTCSPIEGEKLSEQLDRAVSRLRADAAVKKRAERQEKERGFIPATADVRNFTHTIIDGKMYFRENNIMTEVRQTGKDLERMKGLHELRITMRGLIDAQSRSCSDDELHALQDRLNEQYDSFTKRFGSINDRANTLVFREDDDYNTLCSLENVDPEKKTAEKSDIFTQRTIKPSAEISHVDTPQEALQVSIDMKGRVDIEFMAELCEKAPETVAGELSESGMIYLNPEKYAQEKPFEGYEEASEYLSGNVREKLRAAEFYAEKNPELFARNAAGLADVLPPTIGAGDITAHLGASWVDVADYEKFLKEYIGRKVPFITLRRTIAGEYKLENKTADRSVAATNTFGTERMSAYFIYENLLNHRDVTVKDRVDLGDDKYKYVVNTKETQLAAEKARQMNEAFSKWLWSNPERREKYVERYNNLFNSIVGRHFDGSHQTFPGMSPFIQLKPHQKDAVARAKFGGNTLLAHCVGAGKSFEMIAATMEKKRLGLINKACVVVPKALVGQTANEWLRLYPQAKILVAADNDFSKDNRQKFIGRCCTGDYAAVVMSYEQFEKIQMSVEYRQQFLQKELDNIQAGLDELHPYRDRTSIKDLQREQKRIKAKIEKLLDTAKTKDTSLTFEQLGFDSLVVDEAHNYKNGLVITKMNNVSGVQTTAAQKSEDILMKTQYLNENFGEKNIIFATGTPAATPYQHSNTKLNINACFIGNRHNLNHR